MKRADPTHSGAPVSSAAWCALVLLTAISLPCTAAGFEALSESSRFTVRLQVDEQAVRLGKFQNWVLSVHAVDGEPVYPARILLTGGMPGHGHGMPTQPRVTEYLGDGQYRVEGMKFNMMGSWEFSITIDAPLGRDRAQLKMDLDY